MPNNVLITGGNGHLAKRLGKYLEKEFNVKYLTTKTSLIEKKESFYHWDIEKEHIDRKAIENCNHLVHLAGYPILKKKWSKKNKMIIYNSRVKSTYLLLDTCKRYNVKPETFICASAIGIYDTGRKDNVNENSLKGKNWTAKMTCDWETAANSFKELETRVIQMRISLIFSKHAGYLKYNLLSARYGIGAIIGNKERIINWMHVEDISRFIEYSIKNNNLQGAYNLAANEKISQIKLLQIIRKKLYPYSIIINIPKKLTELILGERFQIINSNIKLETKKIRNTGFKFKFDTVKKLMTELKKK